MASTLGLFAQVAVEAYTTPEEELRQREAQRNNQPLIGKDLSPPDEKPSLNDYKSLLL
ncbi:MAG: hypothetical protein H2069_06640 [Legionella sp.]|nr:hypothetical protein [Legionella sp.]